MNKLIKEIEVYLTNEGMFYWINTQEVFDYPPPITIMLKDSHLYIEVKTLTGKQRDAQEAFEISCKMNGHNYMIARSVACVRNKLKELGVI